jgi:hypothetical protein
MEVPVQLSRCAWCCCCLGLSWPGAFVGRNLQLAMFLQEGS